MLPNNDNKAIMATMNNALILEINIIFFVDSFGGGRVQVHAEGAEFFEWAL